MRTNVSFLDFGPCSILSFKNPSLLRLWLWIIATLLPMQSALAYIPPPRMILSRTAENQGQGTIEIKTEVVINTPQESLLVREIWQIENANSMRVAIYGQDSLKDVFRFDLLYKDGKKFWRTGEGVKSLKIPADFSENWFHARSSEALSHLIVANRMAPENFQNSKSVSQKAGKFTYLPLDFLSLSRVGGVVNYLFGNRLASESRPSPGLWIEQDMFRIRKIRMLSGAEVRADQYVSTKKGIEYPQQRLVMWENGTANIRVMSAGDFKVNSQSFTPAGLAVFSQWPGEKLTEDKPEDQTGGGAKTLKEFYSRFR